MARNRSPIAQTEADFQSAIIKLAHATGWLVHHTRCVRTPRGYQTPVQGDVGFPDLVLAKGGRVVLAELKTDKGKTSAAQREWIEASGAELWRPSDWPAIEALFVGRR